MNNYNNERGGGFNKSRGNFGRGDFTGRPSFGGDKRGGARDRGDRPMQMFSATCATCHKSCEVPFRPSGDKPVYCSNCFTQKGEGETRSFGGDRGDRPRPQADKFSPRKEYTNDRPQSGDGEIKRQLATIEAKLNRILDLINPPMPAEKKVEVPTVSKRKVIEKKEVDKPALKKVVESALEQVADKKVAKKVAKKAVKKVAKKAVKKVAKKTV